MTNSYKIDLWFGFVLLPADDSNDNQHGQSVEYAQFGVFNKKVDKPNAYKAVPNIDGVAINPIANRVSVSKSKIGIEENSSDKNDDPKKHRFSLG